jgi:Flp pilus assembly protein TadG
MATVANIFIDQGSDYSNIVTVTASNGQPLNLTGFTVASQMRKSYSSSTAYAFTASILSTTLGQVRLQLTSTQSEAIPPGRYLYDVEVTSSTGSKTRVVEGIATITPQITQV